MKNYKTKFCYVCGESVLPDKDICEDCQDVFTPRYDGNLKPRFPRIWEEWEALERKHAES